MNSTIRYLTALSVCMGAVAAMAVQVSDVSLSQDAVSRVATVSYQLDAPAIVTVDVRTNRGDGVYVSIGADKLRGIWGDVNKYVTNVNTAVSASWRNDGIVSADAVAAGEVRAVVTAWSLSAPPDYMVFNLMDLDEVRYYVSESALPLPITDRVYKTDKLVLRRIPAAGVRWRMGTPGDTGSEAPQSVTLTEDYYIGVFEFTIGQWRRCMGIRPSDSYLTRALDSAACATSYDYLRGKVSEGINWPQTGSAVLSTSPIHKIRETIGIEVDLPTEAQWEYACRAGTGSELYTCKPLTEDNVSEIAYIGTDTVAVGGKAPNAWGLYDMCGNQLEWCLDWAPTGSTRVMRGGAWNNAYQDCRSAKRYFTATDRNYATLGFRLAAPCRALEKAK